MVEAERLGARLQVAAGAEGLVARAGEHDHPVRRIALGLDHRVGDLAHDLIVEGVADFRPVEGQPENAILRFGQDQGCHCR